MRMQINVSGFYGVNCTDDQNLLALKVLESEHERLKMCSIVTTECALASFSGAGSVVNEELVGRHQSFAMHSISSNKMKNLSAFTYFGFKSLVAACW